MTGKGDKKLMTAVTTADAGKTVVKIPTIEKPMDDFLDVRLPKSEFGSKPFVIDADEFLEIVLNTAIPTRGFRIAWTIDCWSVVHGLDNDRRTKGKNQAKLFRRRTQKSPFPRVHIVIGCG